MKLYNPFKFHPAQFSNGKFGVRKLSITGFDYLDMCCKFTTYKSVAEPTWFRDEYIVEYCMVDTKEQAIKQLERFLFIRSNIKVKAKAV